MDTELYTRLANPSEGPFATPTTTTKDTWVTQAVADKAAVLDEINPGWAARIDTANLDMAKGCKCVLGQVFGSFEDGIFNLFEVYGIAGLRYHDLVFQERPGVHQAWIGEIERRSGSE